MLVGLAVLIDNRTMQFTAWTIKNIGYVVYEVAHAIGGRVFLYAMDIITVVSALLINIMYTQI